MRPAPSGSSVAPDNAVRDLGVIGLTHGRALWVLRELGFSEGASDITFNYYIKSLRKLGLPFSPGQNRYWSGRLARYSYEHLMELALALTLRVYGTLPDTVMEGMVAYRQDLNLIYRRAYEEREQATKVLFRSPDRRQSELLLRGLYLDLQILFSGGRLVRFGPPRVLLPHEAMNVLADGRLASRASIPVHISHLARRVVDLALQAPVIRRGPEPVSA